MNGSPPLSRFTVHLDAESAERVKNAAAAAGAHSVAALLTVALMQHVVDLEREMNGGSP